jgi:hypothetical protein
MKEIAMSKSLFHNAVTEIKLRRLAAKEHNALLRIITPTKGYWVYLSEIVVGMLIGTLLIIGLFA